MLLRVALPLFLFGLPLDASGQLLQPYFHNFTTADGLPSSEVYCILQDEEGYMWFGTDNGVARYDGYQFKVFDSHHGLEDAVVFQLRLDDEGVIWASTYSGRLYYFDGSCFQPAAGNDELEAWKLKNRPIILVDPDFDDRFLIFEHWKGFLSFDGVDEFNELSKQVSGYVYVYHNSNADNPLNNNVRIKSWVRLGRGVEFYQIFTYDTEAGTWTPSGSFTFGKDYIRKIVPLNSNNHFLAFTNSYCLHIVDNEVVNEYAFPTDRINYISFWGDKGLLVCADGGNGLLYVSGWEKPSEFKIQTLLAGRSISYAAQDREGGLWVATLDAGLFYSSQVDQTFLARGEQLPDTRAVNVAPVNDNAFFVAFSDGSTRYYDINTKEELLLHDTTYMSRSIFYDDQNHRLYDGISRFDINWELEQPQIRRADESTYNYLSRIHSLPEFRSYQLVRQNGREQLLTTSTSRIGIFDLENLTPDFWLNFESQQSHFITAECFHIGPNGRYWIGTVHGLFEFHLTDSLLIVEDLGIDALKERVVDIENLPNQGMIFATRGQGLVYYDRDTSFQLTVADGLASDLIRHLYQPKPGELWVATLSGLSRVQLIDEEELLFDVKTFNEAHGIPSQEIYYTAGSANYIWLATAEGVVKFSPPEELSSAPLPIIAEIYINEQLTSTQRISQLPAGEIYDLRLHFHTLDFSQLGKNHYRYRLQADQKWSYTEQHEVSFPRLQAGAYQFELQSQNPDGKWSESISLPIKVAASWYNRWPARLLFVLLLAGTISSYFILRERRRKSIQAVEKQIRDLERSALHAQMNPHFVFNSLNSIQSFILDQDTRSAVDYLAQFSRLIRDTLRVSAKGVHSLEEEVNMLRNYLNLEKLRFKQGLDYQIELDDHLNPAGLVIPALLIQPFVENAIKHGLKENEEGGQVKIHFGGTASQLRVSIQDNGRGFDPRKSKKSGGMGMDITRRRLELLKKRPGGLAPMDIRFKYEDDGTISGTEIIILIDAEVAAAN
ncbi:MAG: histidine kinase [Bacteroidota bacterium]